MPTDNLSAVLYGIDDLRMEQRPIPTPGENQLLINIHTVGVCGTDIHFFKHGAVGSYKLNGPLVIGHETSGTVAGLGPNVKGFKVGDRVALEVGVPCRRCDLCRMGRYNICPNMKFRGLPPVDGTLTRYLVHDADFCYKLPDNVSYEEGALLEPLTVAVHGCRRGRVQMGQYILVQGAGPIGVMSLLTARALGAAKVVITDFDSERLKLAKQLGADHILCTKGMSVDQIRTEVIKCLGREPEITLECTGAQSCIESGILTTRRGGAVVLVGLGAPRDDLPIIEAVLKEVDIIGSILYANCYPIALDLVASGRVNLSGLTRVHYKLEDAVEAFKRKQKLDVMKVFIDCQK